MHTRRDLTITGLYPRMKFLKYLGFVETSKNDKINDQSTKWSDKDKTLPGVFGVWCYNELLKIGQEKGHNLSKFFNGTKGITEKRFQETLSGYHIQPVLLYNSGIRFFSNRIN